MRVLKMRAAFPVEDAAAELPLRLAARPRRGIGGFVNSDKEWCREAHRAAYGAGGCAVHVLIFEKYYARASGYISLTVILTGDGQGCEAEALTFAGTGGAMDAEEDFIGGMRQTLEDLGFVRVEDGL